MSWVNTTRRIRPWATNAAGSKRDFASPLIDIHALRRAACMSQSELAARAQVARGRLSASEQGYMQLSGAEVLRAAWAILRVMEARTAQLTQCAAQIREALASSNDTEASIDGEDDSLHNLNSPVIATARGKANGKAAAATGDDSRYTIDLVDEYGRRMRVNLQQHLAKYTQDAEWQDCWRDKAKVVGHAHVKLTSEELKVCGRTLFEFAQWLEWGEVKLPDPELQEAK